MTVLRWDRVAIEDRIAAARRGQPSGSIDGMVVTAPKRVKGRQKPSHARRNHQPIRYDSVTGARTR